MPRQPTSARCAQLVRRLSETYPAARCELNFASPLHLLVAVILSAQCTDKRVNLVTPALFRKYPDAAALAGASQEEIEAAVRSTGFFRNKARNIRECGRTLVEKHGGQVPDTMEELVALNGVGRKTANVVLSTAFGKNEGVCVDTHVLRVAGRLGLSADGTPEGVETDLMRLFPREQWGKISTWLIWHGRRRCGARHPDCANCELKTLCPSRKIFSVPLKK